MTQRNLSGKHRQILFSVNSNLCLRNWSAIFLKFHIPLCYFPLFFWICLLARTGLKTKKRVIFCIYVLVFLRLCFKFVIWLNKLKKKNQKPKLNCSFSCLFLFWFVLYHLCFLNWLCSAKLFQTKREGKIFDQFGFFILCIFVICSKKLKKKLLLQPCWIRPC